MAKIEIHNMTIKSRKFIWSLFTFNIHPVSYKNGAYLRYPNYTGMHLQAHEIEWNRKIMKALRPLGDSRHNERLAKLGESQNDNIKNY